jgi:ferritin-like metal-binding protein YciE
MQILRMKNTMTVCDLFQENLETIYYAEKHLTDVLGKMQGKSASYELKNTLTDYREVTKGQVKKIEEVFYLLGQEPAGRKCETIKSIIREADDIMRETTVDDASRDAGLIVAARKAKHYGMIIYDSLVILAKKAGLSKAVTLLQRALEEERKADTMFDAITQKLMFNRLGTFIQG